MPRSTLTTGEVIADTAVIAVVSRTNGDVAVVATVPVTIGEVTVVATVVVTIVATVKSVSISLITGASPIA